MINGKLSGQRVLNNGLPQESVLSCLLHCVYTSDLPQIRQFRSRVAYQSDSFEDIENVLNEDLRKLSSYFKDLRLKANPGETIHCVQHLTNQLSNRKFKLQMDGKVVEHDPNPKYLGTLLDRSLTDRPQLVHTRNKLRSRTSMLQKLAGTIWGCTPKTLRITTQAMVMSVANYCSSVWMNSAHVNQVDTQINKMLRIVSGTQPKQNG